MFIKYHVPNVKCETDLQRKRGKTYIVTVLRKRKFEVIHADLFCQQNLGSVRVTLSLATHKDGCLWLHICNLVDLM